MNGGIIVRFWYVPAGVIAIGVIAIAVQSARAELLFYESFDNDVRADFAVGDPAAGHRDGTDPFRLTSGKQGKWGEALNAGKSEAGRSLRYDLAGNLSLRKGTIEFVARMEDIGTEWGPHEYFTATGKRPFRLDMGRPPKGKGLLLSWYWNGHNGWVWHAQRYITFGRWQHYAVTWDMTAGKGKGVLSVYVDGKRRIHVTDLDPYRCPPEHLHIGGPSTLWGHMDDFAVFDEIRYSGNFSPRQESLAGLAKDAAQKKSKAPVAGASGTAMAGTGALMNGGFEEWSDGKPSGWELEKGKAFEDRHMRMSGNRSLRLEVDRMDKASRPAAQISSVPLSLEKYSNYRLGFWLAKHGSAADMRITVHASDGAVVASYRSEWVRGHPWMRINKTFQTRGCRQHYVRIYIWTDPGCPAWIDDMVIAAAGGLVAGPTSTDADRGFQLFSRSVMESYGVQSKLPSPDEIVDSLDITLGRDEYEPALLGLRALRTLQDVDVSVAADLTGPNGAKLASSRVSIRRLQGALLPLSRPRSVRSGEVIAWWVTVKAEKNSAAGAYEGKLNVLVSGKKAAELPLRVNILDLTLPKPDVAFLVYHNETYFQTRFLTPELRAVYFRDMCEHGMNTVTVYNNPDVDGTKVDFSHNYYCDPEKRPQEFAVGLDAHIKKVLDAGLCAKGEPVLWLPAGHGYGWGDMPKAAMKASLTQWNARKWPTPLLYVFDEPGSEERIRRAMSALKRIKSWNLPVKTTTAGLDADALGKYYDVWIQNEGSISYEMVQKAQEMGAELWTYNCRAPHENMPFPRAFYGFWAFRSGVKGVAQWAYYDWGEWYADADGNVLGKTNKRLSRVCASPVGPIPTISWEATREGVDDYRYAQQLRGLLAKAEGRLTNLDSRADKLLSDEEKETIDKREAQRVAKHNPEAQVIVWKAPDAAKAHGEKIYLACRDLRRELGQARVAMDGVIGTIPLDAMATRIGVRHGDRWARFCPPLGPLGVGDTPTTMAEDKRRILASYIICLQQALLKTEQFEAK